MILIKFGNNNNDIKNNNIGNYNNSFNNKQL